MMQFEKLEVWKLAIEFSTDMYRLTSRFPKSELYGLTSQLRRAGTSISLNIAEGSGRASNKEFCRFIDIALSSALECVSGLFMSLKLEFATQKEFEEQYMGAERIIIKLYALKKYLKKVSKPQPSTINYKP